MHRMTQAILALAAPVRTFLWKVSERRRLDPPLAHVSGALCALLLLLAPRPAGANVTYHFSGVCNHDCLQAGRAGSPDTIGDISSVSGFIELNVNLGERWDFRNIVNFRLDAGLLTVTPPNGGIDYPIQVTDNTIAGDVYPYVDPGSGRSLFIINARGNLGADGMYVAFANFLLRIPLSEDPGGSLTWTRTGGGGPAPTRVTLLDVTEPASFVNPLLDNRTCLDSPTAPAVTTDPARLSTCGFPVLGTAADGASRLLIRVDAPGPGTVTFSLGSGATGDPRFDGDFERIPPAGTAGQAPTVQTAAGHQAFVIYRAPIDFTRPGTSDLPGGPDFPGSPDLMTSARDITLQVSFNGNAPTLRTIRIFRPPVLLVHGLWSGAETWRQQSIDFEAAIRAALPGLIVALTDYRLTSAAHFSANANVVQNDIRDLRTRFQNITGAAVSQVDVIGHSMGGILTRIWAEDPRYRSRRNNFAGDLHKLITLDSPHRGSFAADLASLLPEQAVRMFDFWLRMPIHLGAMADLETDSSRILGLGAPQARYGAHALFGQVAFDVSPCLPGVGLLIPDIRVKVLFTALCWFLDDPGISITDTDGAVGLASQLGGLAGDHMTTEVPLFHWQVTSSTVVVAHVVSLLNAPVGGGHFATEGFPAAQGQAVQAAVVPSAETAATGDAQSSVTAVAGAAATAAPVLAITAPAAGATAVSGDTIRVVVQPSPGTALASLLVAFPGGASVLGPPFEISVQVPVDFVGDFTIAAIGKLAGGDFAETSVTIAVTTAAALQAITVTPEAYSFSVLGAVRGLLVEGAYADGVPRDLTAAGAGTTYTSSDPGVVVVDTGGQLQAIANGTATITVRNGAFQDVMTVAVAGDPTLASLEVDRTSTSTNGLVVVTLTGGPGNGGDWLAIGVVGEPGTYVPGKYLYVSGRNAATWTIAMPSTPGTYEARLYLRDSFTLGATSAPITVSNAAPVTLTVVKTGTGTVASAPAGIDCGSACVASFANGTSVTLTATASGVAVFSGWGGDCSGTASTCTVVLTAAKSVSATFTAGGGTPTLTVSPSTVGPGGSVTVTLTGGPGNGGDWLAIGVVGEAGSYVPGKYLYVSGRNAATWTVTMPSTPGAYEARLYLRDSFTLGATSAPITVSNAAPVTLTVVKTGTGSGTVASAPAGIDCGSACAASFASGTSATLTATAGGAAVFSGWGGDCSGTASTCTVALTAAKSVSATFTAGGGTPTLTVSPSTVGPGGSVTVTLTGGPGNGGDWLAIGVVGADPQTYVSGKYVYVSGLSSATWTVAMPSTPGTYEARLYLRDGWMLGAASAPITVTDAAVTSR